MAHFLKKTSHMISNIQSNPGLKNSDWPFNVLKPIVVVHINDRDTILT